MAEYIEREAAISAINKFKGPTRSPAQNDLIWGAVKLVERIPAADVAPVRHGRWILEPTNPYDDPGYKNRMIKLCSVCHWSNACKYNYCPNCGAKMDEKDVK